MEDQEPKHVRRVRYKGKHPKAFKEKYKELSPEQYSEDVAKVMQQGRTPAGMHRSICIEEIMEFLNVTPGQIGLDATLGYGGHTVEIAKRLIPGGKLYAIDVDPIELPKTRERLAALGFGPDVVEMKIMNFSQIDQIIFESGLLNFVLADLGVSSMQIDNPDRGFSFKIEGPLDLRLNPKNGIPASEFLKNVSRDELEELLQVNADEPHYIAIAKGITSKIKKGIKIETTTQLKEIIQEALEYLPENMRVKKSFKELFRAGVYSEIAPDPIRPSAEESNTNPRARSAKLRWAIKE